MQPPDHRVLLAALVVVVAPPAAVRAAVVDRTVSAGPLTATVTTDPWSLTFSGARGRTVLAEATGTGIGATGTVGFQTAVGWFHATRVLDEARDGAAYTAHLATSDPAGRTLAIRLAPDVSGVLAFGAEVQGGGLGDVQQTGIAFAARPGEHYLGFGERSNAVDQHGNDLEDFVSDGPYQPDERPFIAAFVPLAGYHPRDDATYFPVPWLLSTAGYGVLLDRDEQSLFRLGTEGVRQFSGPGPGTRFFDDWPRPTKNPA